MKSILDIITQHKAGDSCGIYCVCSAHPLVIEAAIVHAQGTGDLLVIEATSNQVNQYGGYTGMMPEDFRKMVSDIASRLDFPLSRIVFGGDHLGPNCWQHLDASEAMARSDVLIDAYVRAGFRKIHLDCSMACADDTIPLDDGILAERAARLCAVAERAWKDVGGEAPVYIVGTEVPVPGGAKEDIGELLPTSKDDATTTLETHKAAFADAGLTDAWQRVIALVVQPGVEFDHHGVIAYQPERAEALSQYSETQERILFEAHSTDYQSEANLTALVSGHFAILKVGPWLTFALREACWALDAMEQEWLPEEERAQLRASLLQVMKAQPEHWEKYYDGERYPVELDCQYSFSDRIRYYWPMPEVQQALARLMENFDRNPPPLTLLSQYMPEQYSAVNKRELALRARDVILHKITRVLSQYSIACRA